MVTKPTLSIILDTRKANAQKLFPVKLRATFQVYRSGQKRWLQKYYSLKRYLSKNDFKLIMTKPRNDEQRKIRAELLSAEQRANQILNSHTAVDSKLFDRLFTGGGDMHDVATVFDMKISELEKEGQVGTAGIYSAVKNSVIRFSGGVVFAEITVDWLRRYSKWLQSHEEGEETVKVSPSTIGIYMRHLRAIYNMAIRFKLINRDMYPFGREGYLIKKTQGRKIALDEADKNRLLTFQPNDDALRFSIDFWMFSYFCFGLNMTDIALLRLKDIANDVIVTAREKKKNTDTTGQLLGIPLRPEAKEIIQRWGNKTLNPNDFVFPILTHGLTPRQIKNRIKDFTKDVNAGLKRLCQKFEWNIKLTTYTARHTFSSVALNNGASKEFIQHALGHGSILTTEAYTAGFWMREKIKVSAGL